MHRPDSGGQKPPDDVSTENHAFSTGTDTREINEFSQKMSRRLPSDSPEPNAPSRSPRQANDELDKVVDRMRQVSRVVNGIALQQGIAKSEIQTDELIAELLNFGSATIDQVRSMDIQNMKQVAKDVQDLHIALKAEKEFAGIEDRFKLYSSMLDMTKDIKNDFTLPQQKDFFIAANKLTTAQFDATTESSSLAEALKTLDAVKNNAPNTVALTSYNILVTVAVCMQAVKDLNLDGLKSISKELVLQNVDKNFKPLINVHKAVTTFQNTNVPPYHRNDDAIVTKIGDQMKKLDDVAGKAETSRSNFVAADQIFVSRNFGQKSSLKHTAGFPGGCTDLEDFSLILKEAWMNSAVDEQSEQLASFLSTLDLVGKSCVDVAQHLVLGTTNQDNLPKFIEELDRLSKVSKDLQTLSSGLGKVKIVAGSSQMAPNNVDTMSTLLTNMQTLSKTLESAQNIVNVLSGLQKNNRKDIDDIMKAVQNLDMKNALKIHGELQKKKEFLVVYEAINSIRSDIDTLAKQTIVETAGKLKTGSSDIDAYRNELVTFFTELDKLRAVNGIDSLGAALQTLEDFRKPTAACDMDDIGKKHAAVAKKMPTLEKSINDIPNDESVKSNWLVTMQSDVSGNSKVIGSATRGVLDLEKLLEKKKDLQALLKNINTEMAKVTLDQTDQAALSNLVKTLSNLGNMYSLLDVFKNEAKLSESPNLADQSSIFVSAKKVQGPDVKSFIKSVEALINKVPDAKTKADLRKILPILESFGFIQYSADFEKAKDSLADMDLVFAQYKKAPTASMAPGGVTTPKSLNGSSAILVTDELGEDTSEGGIGAGTVVGIIVLAAIGVSASGGFAFCLYNIYNKKHEEPEEKEGKESTSLESVVVLPQKQTPAVPTPTKNADATNPPPKDDLNKGQKGGNNPPSKDLQNGKSNSVEGAKVSKADEKVPTEGGGEGAKTDVTVANIQAPRATMVDGLTMVTVPHLAPFLSIDDIKRNILVLPPILDEYLKQISNAYKLLGKECRLPKKQYRPWIKLYAKTCYKVAKIAPTSKSVRELYSEDMRHSITYSAYNRTQLKHGKTEKDRRFIGNIIMFPNNQQRIMTQGVHDTSSKKVRNIEKFWRLAKEQSVQKIVMLAKLIEGGEEKVSRYYPETADEPLKLKGLIVYCTKKEDEGFKGELEVRTLSVVFEGEEPFVVTHYLYKGWSDHGVPKRSDVIIHLLKKVRVERSPVIVHCSAGLGRTGVFVYIELYMHLLVAFGANFYPANVLNELRTFRSNAIQTEEQYLFAHAVAFKYLFDGFNVEKGLSKDMRPSYSKVDQAMTEIIHGDFIKEDAAIMRDAALKVHEVFPKPEEKAPTSDKPTTSKDVPKKEPVPEIEPEDQLMLTAESSFPLLHPTCSMKDIVYEENGPVAPNNSSSQFASPSSSSGVGPSDSGGVGPSKEEMKDPRSKRTKNTENQKGGTKEKVATKPKTTTESEKGPSGKP